MEERFAADLVREGAEQGLYHDKEQQSRRADQ